MSTTVRRTFVPFVPRVAAMFQILLLSCMVCSSLADVLPSFVQSPVDQTGVSGGVASFVCEATGQPKPRITWMKGGTAVSPSQSVVVKEFGNGSGSVLRISPLHKQNHEGRYECIATTRAREVSIAAQLTVLEENQTPQGFPAITSHPQLRTVEKYRTVFMLCSATGNPEPEVSWYKDLLPLDKTSSHFKQRSSGVLQIESTEESDEGTYECMASNSAGTRFSHPANLYVRVRRMAPFISVAPTNQEVRPGGSVNLTCVAEGEPRPYVTWMMGKNHLTKEHDTTRGQNVLQLTGIRESANYTCVAASSLGFTAATAQVTVNGSPSFIKSLEDQTGVSGGVASFVCQATGEPKPTITWKKNGKKINSLRSQSFEVFNSDDGSSSVLRIQTMRKLKNEGIYECIATNSQGEINSTAKLTVLQESPQGFPTFVTSPQLSVVEKTRTAFMRCSASGNPEPEISWFKDNLPVDIHGSNGRITQLSSGSLRIDNSGESDQGRYECVATNSVGTQYSVPTNLYVRVRKVPPRFIIPPTDQKVQPGESVNLTCAAVGSPMPYVKWTKGTEDLTPEDQIPMGTNVLQLINIWESANFTCVAESSLGVIKATALIRVIGLPIAPTSVTVTETAATSATLTWDYEDDEPFSYFTIQYKAKNSGSLHDVTGVFSFRHSLDGLSPNTAYQFKVRAVNTIGKGPPSAVVEARTAELAPSSPPLNLQADMLSAGSMLVKWEPPLEPNGQIRGYRVYYSANLTAPLSAWREINTVEKRIVIEELMPNVFYGLRVLGFTSEGDGPLSDVLQVKTEYGVPGKPEVRSQVVGGDTAVIEWQPPTEVIGEVIGYRLQYKRTDDEDFKSRDLKKGERFYIISKLDRGATYIFRLSAQNDAGFGEATVKEIRTEEEPPPGFPVNLQATELTQSSVQLTWKPPQRRETVIYYTVVYRDIDSQQNKKVLTTDTHVTLECLKPDTTYDIRVQAYTSHGAGPLSPSIQSKTKPDVFVSWLSFLHDIVK